MHNKKGPSPLSVYPLILLFRSIQEFAYDLTLIVLDFPHLEIYHAILETLNDHATSPNLVYCILKLLACPYCHSNHIWHNDPALIKVRYLSCDATKLVLLKLAKERIICQDCGQTLWLGLSWLISTAPLSRLGAITTCSSISGSSTQVI